MRLFLIYLFYYLGDIISRTTMQWFNGLGYGLYSKLMLWSSDLDLKNILWKSPKDNNHE
jgi:hypothetical protein